MHNMYEIVYFGYDMKPLYLFLFTILGCDNVVKVDIRSDYFQEQPSISCELSFNKNYKKCNCIPLIIPKIKSDILDCSCKEGRELFVLDHWTWSSGGICNTIKDFIANTSNIHIEYKTYVANLVSASSDDTKYYIEKSGLLYSDYDSIPYPDVFTIAKSKISIENTSKIPYLIYFTSIRCNEFLYQNKKTCDDLEIDHIRLYLNDCPIDESAINLKLPCIQKE